MKKRQEENNPKYEAGLFRVLEIWASFCFWLFVADCADRVFCLPLPQNTTQETLLEFLKPTMPETAGSSWIFSLHEPVKLIRTRFLLPPNK